MFVASMTNRNPIASYIQKAYRRGRFLSPSIRSWQHAGFSACLPAFVLWQEIFGFKKTHPYDREEVVHTFVSIFLKGITKQ
jgi:hypothetical protein